MSIPSNQVCKCNQYHFKIITDHHWASKISSLNKRHLKVQIFWEVNKIWKNLLIMMCGSCHDHSNDEFSVEFWMFVLIIFQPTLNSDLKEVQFTQCYLFWVKAPLYQYLKGAPNFKTLAWLKKITIPNIQNPTLNLTFDTLTKWQDPDIRNVKKIGWFFKILWSSQNIWTLWGCIGLNQEILRACFFFEMYGVKKW